MHLEIPHNKSKAAALAHVQKALSDNRGELAKHATITKEEWQDNTLEFAVELQGKKISGTLMVDEQHYVVDATLPLMWRLFERQIEAEVKKQVEQMSR